MKIKEEGICASGVTTNSHPVINVLRGRPFQLVSMVVTRRRRIVGRANQKYQFTHWMTALAII